MNIELKEITIREVTNGYRDSAEEGVFGYGGKLNIRPKYQREFVYKAEQRDAVIDTIRKGFPLNVMYWVKNEDGTFEVLDGQQRTISFCQYVNNDFSIDNRMFHNLTRTEQDEILDYKLMVYFCEGNDREKLDWFTTINIAGEKLFDQELRNAVYTGTWLTDAKSKFSKSNCPAFLMAKEYLSGNAIRQDYLETALDWISQGNIRKYMSEHQHDQNANELWLYFRNVIEWVKVTFPKYRPIMKGINWGELYDQFGSKQLDVNALEEEISKLLIDDDVSSRKGVYHYVLTRNVKHLNIRAFTEKERIQIYEIQGGKCADCQEDFSIKDMEAHHKVRWVDGGHTEVSNGLMLCKTCHHNRHSNR